MPSNLFDTLLFQYLAVSFGAIMLTELLVVCGTKKVKNISIILLSAGLLAWLDLGSFFILGIFSSVIYWLVQVEKNIRKFALKLSASLILTLIILKEAHHLFSFPNSYVPLGVSYYFFRLISYVLDYAKNPKAIREKTTFYRFYTWVFFFPIFFAGPIQRFVLFDQLPTQAEKKNVRLKLYAFLMVIISLKIILVDSALFPWVYDDVFSQIKGGGGRRRMILVFGVFAFLHAYLDLMLYTEISKSMGRILGFKVQDNFNRPLLASNISQFWQRYHMSLSSWTRDYVFFPLAAKTRNFTLASYASMMTMGMWHNISWNWFVWAICHGSLLSTYNILRTTRFYKELVSNGKMAFTMRWIGNFFTIIFVGIVFIFVSMKDFNLAWRLVRRLLIGY